MLGAGRYAQAYQPIDFSIKVPTYTPANPKPRVKGRTRPTEEVRQQNKSYQNNMALQRDLQQLGLYKGKIDGIIGRQTTAAARKAEQMGYAVTQSGVGKTSQYGVYPPIAAPTPPSATVTGHTSSEKGQSIWDFLNVLKGADTFANDTIIVGDKARAMTYVVGPNGELMDSVRSMRGKTVGDMQVPQITYIVNAFNPKYKAYRDTVPGDVNSGYMTSPAGVFTSNVEDNKSYRGNNHIVRLVTPSGETLGMTYHGLPSRNDADPADVPNAEARKMTAGCQRMPVGAIDRWVDNKYFRDGRVVVMLPEEEGNEIVATPDGGLQLNVANTVDEVTWNPQQRSSHTF